MGRIIFVIFLIALVVYVVYYVVTNLGFVKFPVIPSYLSPVSPTGLHYNPPAAPAGGAGTTYTPSAPPSPPSPSARGGTVTPPQGFTADNLSPFYKRVRLSSVIRPSRTTGGGSFAIRADSSLPDPVDVTGWRVRGNKYEVTLHGGGAPLGPVNQVALILRPGETLTVYGATSNYLSQIRNVHLNKCTGYLNDVYDLRPRVPEQCPRRDRSEFMTFGGVCQSYLLSLGTCKTPSPSKINELSYDSACRAFLDTLNYDSCERAHRSDANFWQSGWRAWLINSLQFDVSHDRLLLFDAQGLVVSEYVY